MTKTVSKTWTAPKLNKLGSLKDVAGSKTVSNDGPSSNTHS